ncbi:hypothetical protein [Micromonospora sp. NBC_01638]|uniref:hypothetical protein n=1 Tax=Micromonospora sp. NBC_01638 TaxID=2975982 RepID=UPI0038633504|nr:hypothetical protein OG811_04580 [Micromonospora sp. NBC_01638]
MLSAFRQRGQPARPMPGAARLRAALTGFVCMTCGTFLLVPGASPRTVLGHSQIGLTMNTYVHVLPDIERAAVDEAAKHLFG